MFEQIKLTVSLILGYSIWKKDMVIKIRVGRYGDGE